MAPTYTIEVFEDIGKAFCIGLLDFYNCNPISRITQSNLKSLEGVKNDLLSHYPIFLPKKKEEEEPKGGQKKKPIRKANSLQRPAHNNAPLRAQLSANAEANQRFSKNNSFQLGKT